MEDKIVKNVSLSVLDVRDESNIYGGSIVEALAPVLKKLTPAAFGLWMLDNWQDVKKGFSDGWNVK